LGDEFPCKEVERRDKGVHYLEGTEGRESHVFLGPENR
jgi:hypothetical protein